MAMHVAGGGWGPPQGGGPGGWGSGGPPPAPPGGGGGWGPPGSTPPPGGYGAPPGGSGPAGGGPGGHGPPGGPTGYGPPPAGAPQKKGAGTGLIIGIAVAGLLLVAGIVTVVALLLFARPSTSGPSVSDGKGGTVTLPAKVRGQADRHLPSGCEAVLRVDVAKALELPAMQRHVVPALDEIEADGQQDALGKQLKEFVRQTGIEPKKDIKEALMCAVDLQKRGSEPRFAMIFGGDLRPETVVAAFEATEVPKPESSTFDGRKVATGRDDEGKPVVVGQAADATVVFANDRTLFEQAVKESDNYRDEYSLPTTSEASFMLGRAFIDATMGAGSRGGAGNPLAADLAAITRVLGIVQLQNPRGELRITMATARDAARFDQTVTTTLLPGFRASAGRDKSRFGEIEALKAAKSRVDGNDVVIEAPWTAQGVEQAAVELAKEIREAKAKGF